MIKIGLFGYSGSGKTYIFKKLTGKETEIFDPFTPNIGIGTYKDEKLEKITEIIKPKKVIYPEFEINDFKGFPESDGFPSEYFKNLFDMDILLLIIKNFSDEFNPEAEMASLIMELIYHDIERVESIIEARKKEKGNIEIWEKCLEFLKNEKFLKDMEIDKKKLLGAELITLKEFLIFSNGNKKEIKGDIPVIYEINEIYRRAIEKLGMITFYTIKGDIAQAWIIPKNLNAKQAGGKIHKDIEKGFIKGISLSFKEFVEIGDWQKAKNMGALKLLGPNSYIFDGDIVEFYFTK
jgi:ribosome-binding ATPase YchF (GTP1/OBG family)